MKVMLEAGLVVAATAMSYVYVHAEQPVRQVPARVLAVPDTAAPAIAGTPGLRSQTPAPGRAGRQSRNPAPTPAPAPAPAPTPSATPTPTPTASVISPDRLTKWNPGILSDDQLGLPLGVDGLPSRTQICATLNPGDDIQKAINNCASFEIRVGEVH